MKENPSPKLVQQRVRNRIIEYLRLAASFEEQRAYQEAVKFVNVPAEVINLWEDLVFEDPDYFSWEPGIFTDTELEALWVFHRVWDHVADNIPDPTPDLQSTQELNEWHELREAARGCLEILMERGRMSEDVEE